MRFRVARFGVQSLAGCAVALLVGMFIILSNIAGASARAASPQQPPVPLPDATLQFVPTAAQAAQRAHTTASIRTVQANRYTLLAWNDLGMHCYNRDFQDLAVLPPYNNLWAQVVRVGNPPQLITTTVDVSYSFPDNSYSVGKSNFWDFDQALFGVDLAPNVGLAGKSLNDTMDAKLDHFVAEGIPLTEFSDSAPTTPYPYQLATVIARAAGTNAELARLQTVAPVSTEMHCDYCHSDGGVEEISTGRVETNILTLHDKENADEYPVGHTTPLMQRRPVLCAECHSSNALGAPGVQGLDSLSRVMHSKHAGKVENSTQGCYNCHPGPTTKCLRDVMSQQHNMNCVDCHGNMEHVASNPQPWLSEPRCDSCHKDPQFAQNQPLYRHSTGHGGIYCAACHDSPHAIAPSREANDALKFVDLQGKPGPLVTCTVCHLTTPTGAGPHGITAPSVPVLDHFNYLPAVDK